MCAPVRAEDRRETTAEGKEKDAERREEGKGRVGGSEERNVTTKKKKKKSSKTSGDMMNNPEKFGCTY